jgi:hypothetical protein
VVVTRLGTTLTDAEQIARYERLLHPWVNAAMDTVIAIKPPPSMPVKLQRSCHVAVAIPVFAIAGIVTVSPRQKSTESQ